MEAAVMEPRIDENGIPILKGYRPPFNSETAKAASIKGLKVLEARRQALRALAPSIAPKPPTSEVLQLAAKIENLERAHRRCIAAAVASTKGSEAAHWMRAAKDALEQWSSLVKPASQSLPEPKAKRKSVEVPSSIEPLAVQPLASQDSGNCGMSNTTAEPASG